MSFPIFFPSSSIFPSRTNKTIRHVCAIMSAGFSLRSNTLCFLISESFVSDSLGGEEMSSLGRRGCVVCFKVIFIVFLKFGSGVCQLVSLSLSSVACFIFLSLLMERLPFPGPCRTPATQSLRSVALFWIELLSGKYLSLWKYCVVRNFLKYEPLVR